MSDFQHLSAKFWRALTQKGGVNGHISITSPGKIGNTRISAHSGNMLVGSDMYVPICAYREDGKNATSLGAVRFFVILSEWWFWRKIWGPLRGNPLCPFVFCFFGPFSIRMVILALILLESPHMRLMPQKQSSERHQNAEKGPIPVECIMLLFCSRMPILTE